LLQLLIFVACQKITYSDPSAHNNRHCPSFSRSTIAEGGAIGVAAAEGVFDGITRDYYLLMGFNYSIEGGLQAS